MHALPIFVCRRTLCFVCSQLSISSASSVSRLQNHSLLLTLIVVAIDYRCYRVRWYQSLPQFARLRGVALWDWPTRELDGSNIRCYFLLTNYPNSLYCHRRNRWFLGFAKYSYIPIDRSHQKLLKPSFSVIVILSVLLFAYSKHSQLETIEVLQVYVLHRISNRCSCLFQSVPPILDRKIYLKVSQPQGR